MARKLKKQKVNNLDELEGLEYLSSFEEDTFFNEENEYDNIVKDILKSGIGYSNLY